MVYAWIYSVALVNLPLGLYLGWLLRTQNGPLPTPKTVPHEAIAPAATPVVEPDMEEPNAPSVETFEAPRLATSELPAQWLELLESDAEVGSFVEASVKVLKLEVGRYRDRLIGLEEETRRIDLASDELASCLARLEQINADWLVRQSEASGYLQERREGMGSLATIGARLEEVLVNQTAQIESTVNNLRSLDPVNASEHARTQCLVELLRLLGLAHELRDAMADTMSAILGAEDRLGGLKGDALTDELTGVLNRTAEQRKLWELMRDGAHRLRTVSFGLIDLDGLGKLNSKLGVMQVDGVLAATGRLLQSMVRTDRGDDALFRHSGQRFAIFFGDTGPNGATSAVERIRQTVEATTFHLADAEHSLTVTCGVTNVRQDDSIAELLTRTEKVLRTAKSSGRNSTMLDDGEGPLRVDPPQFKVKPRVIELA
jgi:diguanylate cyclase